MASWISIAQLALLGLLLVLILWLALRRADTGSAERLERNLRGDVQDSARGTRQELAQSLSAMQQALLAQSGDVARTQNEQIDSFRTQLAAMQQGLADQTRSAREAQDAALHRFGQAQAEQLRALTDGNDKRMAEVRQTVETKLSAIQADNGQRLEQMRATVDEKLHATLELRLGESFKQVADRLEQVHKGLGEMQTLARDVGSLNRVLTQCEDARHLRRGAAGRPARTGLHARAVRHQCRDGARQRCARRVRDPPAGPRQRWHGQRRRAALAADRRQVPARGLRAPARRAGARRQARADAAGKAIEARLKLEARSISEKYVQAPHTTDFAILFVPTEGLYAEALRRPGLVEALQREHKVMLAGPTTLLATLNSLQMGFRTLALERRSAEVWQVLGAVKAEFGKFGDVLAKTKKKLDEASNTIVQAEVRSRAMERQLRGVEAMPVAGAQGLLDSMAGDDDRDAGDDGERGPA